MVNIVVVFEQKILGNCMKLTKLFGVCIALFACTSMLFSAPVITSISPNKGSVAGGTPVTITGSGFTGATAVDFGTNSAFPFTVVNDNTITTSSPLTQTGLAHQNFS